MPATREPDSASTEAAFRQEVADRFGVMPNFFCTAQSAPKLIEELWGFAKAAFLDSPLPSLFKERLFVHLSRFCEARYCIVRHVGFLIGEGRPAGDAAAPPHSVGQVIALLERPVPDGARLDQALSRLEAVDGERPIPPPETEAEYDLFDALTMIFLEPGQAARALRAVRIAVGEATSELLLAYLAFIRTAHYWTETHAELAYEPDMAAVMDEHPRLSALLLDTTDAERTQAGAAMRKALSELQEVKDALRESEMLRLVALAGGRMGTWNWDLDAQMCGGDAQFMALWGFPPSDEPRPLSDYTDRMTAVGAAEMAEIVNRAVALGDEFDGPLEIVAGPTSGRRICWRGRATAGSPRVLHGVAFDITEQEHAEQHLRESEERQAFLLRLSDALRPLINPVDIQVKATRALGDQLGASRVLYAIVDADDDGLTIHSDFADLAPSIPRTYRLLNFGDRTVATLRRGEILAAPDVHADPGLDIVHRSAFDAIQVRAHLEIPLVKNGRLVAILGVHQAEAREWAPQDIALALEVADRTWAAVERARAEEALRESEERFREFAENTEDVLWIGDAGHTRLEYLSPAFETVYGEGRAAVLADIGRWSDLVHPEDRESAMQASPRLRAGGPGVAEYRIVRPSDGAIRWIRDTGFPIRDAEGHIVRVAGIAQDITELKRADDHQRLLLHELQHRVRNTMGVIRSIARRTADTADTVEDYAAHLDGRINAFARTQAAVTRSVAAAVDLGSILADELRAHAAQEGEHTVLEGPQVLLRPKAAETLGLAFHELTTNAVKYGALAAPGGRLNVTWRLDDARLVLDWVESGLATPIAPPTRHGFGLQLLERTLAYDLDAVVEMTFAPTGLICRIEAPTTAFAPLAT